ncbi:MAG: tRNA pseudouridine(38-40) synthase TruA [Nitrospirota bacterium]|nr:tRNA pseudouridine(38-40) synthase TruA [Nitrospirota bacterium]
MPTWKLTIEYEGTRYRGWQEQINAKTVQDAIKSAAMNLFEGPVELMGGGRTDAGVHAIAQTAHLKGKKFLKPHEILYGLNDRLPADINILDVRTVTAEFHARHSAVARAYLYQISTRRTAFGKPFVWWVKDPLDVKRMTQAAALFEGRHNFASFCDVDTSTGEKAKSTITEVKISRIETSGDLILYRIVASHFLWKMVRRVTGVLVEAGRGNVTERDIKRLLQHPTRDAAPWTAPPSGLFLEKILYQGDSLPEEIRPAPRL